MNRQKGFWLGRQKGKDLGSGVGFGFGSYGTEAEGGGRAAVLTIDSNIHAFHVIRYYQQRS